MAGRLVIVVVSLFLLVLGVRIAVSRRFPRPWLRFASDEESAVPTRPHRWGPGVGRRELLADSRLPAVTGCAVGIWIRGTRDAHARDEAAYDLGITDDDGAGRYEPGQVVAAEGGDEGIRRGDQDGVRLFGRLVGDLGAGRREADAEHAGRTVVA